MSEEFAGERSDLDAWLLLQQTRSQISRSEDRVVGKSGITTEQYTVLLAMECLHEPVRISDIAQRLIRSTNSISMIVDRMVKAGLVDRVRDSRDRREVRVVMTTEGEQAFKRANPAVTQLITDIWSSLPRDDRRTLVRLLETLRDKAPLY